MDNKLLVHALVGPEYDINSFALQLNTYYYTNFLGGINSTDYCYKSSNGLWGQTKRGEHTTNYELRNERGMPATRKCIGDFEYGANWEPEPKYTQNKLKENTKQLVSMSSSISADNFKENVKSFKKLVVTSTSKIETVDVFAMADLFKGVNELKESASQESFQEITEVSLNS